MSFPKIRSDLNWHDEVESLHRQWRCLRSFMHSGCSSPTCSSRESARNLFLRYQLTLALRQKPPRMRLRGTDRALLVWMVRLWPSLLGAVQIVQPEAILRWHRAGVRALRRWGSRNRAGRPRIDRELCELIGRMSMENALWGASRIHGELLKLGYEAAQSTVSKYMARGGRPPSQGWKTFLPLAALPYSEISTARRP